MKMSILCGGRFVAFDIARELQRRSRLCSLITSYPRALSEGLDIRFLRWNPLLGVAERVVRRATPLSDGRVDYYAATRFGRWAAKAVPACDLLQTWSGYALESLPLASARGTTTVLLRGSAHIAAQAALLREECDIWGIDGQLTYPPMVEREMREYEAADFINVISTFALRTFLDQGVPRERLLLTPLGVDVGEVRTQRAAPTHGTPLRVLFLGTVALQKGVPYLWQAVRKLGPNVVRLSVHGGLAPEGRLLLRRFARPGEYRGKVPRSELARVLAEHDVLVLPSVQDGFGAVICEAMAAGLPVIASTNTGGPDVIEDGVTGFIVPPRDVEALADRLQLLADDRGRCAAMGEAAASTMRSRWSWSSFVDDMLEQYDAAHERKRAGAAPTPLPLRTATPVRRSASVGAGAPGVARHAPAARRPASSMKVVIVCGGRFFAFDWARGFHARGELGGLVTAYPRALGEHVPFDVLRWNPLLGLRERLQRRFSRVPGYEIDYQSAVDFGRWAAGQLPRGNVLQAWSGYALESLRVGRARGMTTVALRGSAHIEEQARLMEEEFQRFGMPRVVVSPRMVEREKAEYAEAEYIQVLSTFALNSFLERGFPAERMLMVPTAYDAAEVGGIVRPPARPGPLRVLHLGHVSLRKGVRYLLEAARMLGPEAVTVSLFGGLAEEGKLILARYGKEGEYRGQVSRAYLRSLFASHDVLVAPSIEDGGPASVSEAMGAGLCAIASTNTVGPDLIEDGVTGFLVRPADAEHLADRLAQLVDDRERCRAMGEAAARSLADRATMDHLVDKIRAKYAPALVGRPTHTPAEYFARWR